MNQIKLFFKNQPRVLENKEALGGNEAGEPERQVVTPVFVGRQHRPRQVGPLLPDMPSI